MNRNQLNIQWPDRNSYVSKTDNKLPILAEPMGHKSAFRLLKLIYKRTELSLVSENRSLRLWKYQWLFIIHLAKESTENRNISMLHTCTIFPHIMASFLIRTPPIFFYKFTKQTHILNYTRPSLLYLWSADYGYYCWQALVSVEYQFQIVLLILLNLS